MIVTFHKKFSKRFKKIPKKFQEQFYEKLKIFQDNPFAEILNNHAVHYPYENCRSINITGNLRALYETGQDRVIFIYIGSHSELYK
jgi:mRNA-degrading endonuclease YafQ of YafQ-DinJ toxin-antitoxin module